MGLVMARERVMRGAVHGGAVIMHGEYYGSVHGAALGGSGSDHRYRLGMQQDTGI
jgi:hypothetical protein